MLSKSNFGLYVLDTETTGLDSSLHDVIELSIYRLNDDEQRTWLIKSVNHNTITPEALKVNNHKLEDITHKTEFGRTTYLDPKVVLPEIERWMLSDLFPSEDRILIAQNALFDLSFLQELWKRNNAEDNFPFGRKPFVLDTRQIEILFDLVNNTRQDYYSLSSLVEKYGVKKEKAHRAADDTRMCKDVFIKQLERFKNTIL